MKALTLHQPFATLATIGAKLIETRSWATRYRGPLAIHAAKTMPAYARAFAAEPTLWALLETNGFDRAVLDELPAGAVVAVARLVDCRVIDRAFAAGRPELERMCGNFALGRYAWVLEEVEALDPPVAARGRQRLWEWAA